MTLTDIVAVLVIFLIVGGAAAYIIKAKKSLNSPTQATLI